MLDPIYGRRAFNTVKAVRTPYDIPEYPDSDVLYWLDFAGVLEMEYAINVPSDGLYLRGNGYELTGIAPKVDGAALFTGANAGNIFLEDLYCTTVGLGSKTFDCTNASGNSSVRLIGVNFSGCQDLGELTGYRQIEGNDVGFFGGKPQLTLSGNMNGFFIEKFLVAGLDSDFTGSLFKAGTGLLFSNRFRTNMRANLPTGASISDMSAANFADSSLLQINGGSFARNGVIDSGDNQFFPNLDPEDLVCEWRDNNGLRNTHEGGRIDLSAETASTFAASSTFYDVAGTWAASGLQHFSSPANGQLKNEGKNPQEFMVFLDASVNGNPNDTIGIKLVKWSESEQAFSDVISQRREVLQLPSTGDVAYFTINSPINLEVGDYVKIQIANFSGTSSATIELDSYLQIVRR